jgi:putative peptidoglycan lipid II flippase
MESPLAAQKDDPQAEAQAATGPVAGSVAGTAAAPVTTPVAAPTAAQVGLDSRRMMRAALVVMVFFVLSRFTGILREVILSNRFGTSPEYDAYLAAFRVPDLLFQLAAGGALGSAFLPVFSSFWVKDDKRAAWLLFSRVLNLVTLVLVALAGLAALLAEPIVRTVLAPGFSPEQQMLTAALMRGMLAGTVIFGASGLVMGALNATQHFVAPAAAPVVYNLAIILAAYFLAPSLGIYGLVAGVVGGSLAHLLVQLPALWRRGAVYSFGISLRDASVRTVLKLMGPRVLGLFFVQMHFLVNTILASGLATGSLSALNYAFLLMLLPQGIIAQAIATAAFPTFSAQYAAGQPDMLRRTVSQTLRTVIFLSLPAAALLYMLDRATIDVLFEHGAFTARSTALVEFALQFYLLGLVAHSALEIIVRAFYAVQNTLTPVAVGVAAMLANIGLSFLLVRPLTFGGLALANSVATTLEMLVLLWLLRRRLGGIHGRSLATTALRGALATAVMMAGLALWVQWAPGALPGGEASDWLTAVGGVVLGVGIYCLAGWALRSEELALVLEMVKRRGRRTGAT